MRRALTTATGTSALVLCTPSAANAQPDLPTLAPPASGGAAPTIASAIAIGVIAIATIVRGVRNYLHGRTQATTTSPAHDAPDPKSYFSS
jgi:hypothetical protein